MIETKTTWKDSGYDCDHCGGQIFKRTDKETGQPRQVCFQCRQCGCQWTLRGDVQRVGNLPVCVSSQRQRRSEPANNWDAVWSRRLLIGLAVVAFFVLIRYGGILAFRFLLPIFFGAFIIWSVVRWYRKQQGL